MKKIHSISETGLVLFVDEENKGATTQGTQDDCLAYAYKYQSGNCFAYSQNVTQYERGVNIGNIVNQKNRALGDAITFNSGVNSLASGKGHKVAINGSYSTLNGRNGYSENYGENVYSVSSVKNRARYTELHYVGTTTDDTETELFLGGEGNQRFIPNTEYASCYFIQYFATALNAESQEIWTQQNFVSYRNILGQLQEVGSHSPVTLRDSNLDYDVTLNDFGGANHNYISVDVLGEANHNVVWNVVLQITEVRIEENLSANLILNGDFSELGDELVDITNANPTNGWINLTEFGADFVGGRTTAVRYLSDIPSSITTNKIYRVSVDVENFVGRNTTGISSFGRGATIGTPYVNGISGTILIYTKSTNGSKFRYYARENDQTLDIRNFSIKQADPNDRWNIDTSNTSLQSWMFYENRIRALANSNDLFLQQNFGAKIGSRYLIKYTVLYSTINDELILSANGVFGSVVLNKTVGTHTLILEATNSARVYDLRFVLKSTNSSGVIDLTDISVKELSYGV